MAEVKKSKKKNKVASLLLALALILTCGVAGTIAQYQKSLGGTSTATVASFKVEADNLNATQDANLKLFDNILDTQDGQTETDTSNKVAPGTRGYVSVQLRNYSEVPVSFKLTFDIKDGKAKADYTDPATGVVTQDKEQTIPLEFALTSTPNAPTSDSDWKSLADVQNDKTKSEGSLTAPTSTSSPTQSAKYLHWRWAITTGDNSTGATDAQKREYANRNALDTAIGEAVAAGTFTAPTVTATVQFTQVD